MFESLSRSDGDHQCSWVSKSDIFARENDHSANDEPSVFARFKHSRQIIRGGLRIAAAQAFDKCTDNVVVIVAAVSQSACAKCRFNMFNENLLGVRQSDRHFKRCQYLTSVSPRSFGEKIFRIESCGGSHRSETTVN